MNLPKPTAFFVFANGFLPSEAQIYDMLRAYKAKYSALVTDDHIVGVPTEGHMAPPEQLYRSSGAYKDMNDFTTEGEMRAFMEHPGCFWDSHLLSTNGARGALLIVAVWSKQTAEVARCCLRQQPAQEARSSDAVSAQGTDTSFSCPHCDQHIACDVSYAGEQVKCPTCASDITVPVPTVGRSQMDASKCRDIIHKILGADSSFSKDDLNGDLRAIESFGDQAVPHIEEAVRSCASGSFEGSSWWDNAPSLCSVLSAIETPLACKALLAILNSDSRIAEYDRVRAAAATQLSKFGAMAAELIPELEAASNLPHAPKLPIHNAIKALGGKPKLSPSVIIEQGRNESPREAIDYFAAYQREALGWSRDQRRYFFLSFALKIEAAFRNSDNKTDQANATCVALPYFAAALLADPEPNAVGWSYFGSTERSAETAKKLAEKHRLPTMPPHPGESLPTSAFSEGSSEMPQPITKAVRVLHNFGLLYVLIGPVMFIYLGSERELGVLTFIVLAAMTAGGALCFVAAHGIKRRKQSARSLAWALAASSLASGLLGGANLFFGGGSLAAISLSLVSFLSLGGSLAFFLAAKEDTGSWYAASHRAGAN